ncbi:MAG: hypothetical protein A2822_03295 [Candidatus Staskawiczbacteria bacterium RIFCSPHIGHO2_01_FULL_41_41]|uniref:Peptidase M12B domain-containing protein n=1 Tax=Candidatus Staskawiczbacteria bacterium RIFCSPHIGHO2_01_FULL_41_41 TaxID=1802203 RepID=A0A1G2HT65_9BACT|nr:MAG: hypothetical protein A2822_03295 [Candidatus Staskawiczbacteria bacterium RIFCSPHIGHO2_01_FULL_41_41]HLD79692.1 hypothetical protein [Candidatus Nanoarchaeia archaeon]
MANIKLFDGTENPRYGRVLVNVLAELAKLQRVVVSPTPGGIDLLGYGLVQKLQSESYNLGRRQVDLEQFFELVRAEPMISRDMNSQKIIFVDRDLYSPGRTNWCFGQSRRIDFADYIILSTARIKKASHWFDLAAHELGHMYGAAPSSRTNTVEFLGSHCINDLCVMQQKDTVEGSIAYSRRRHSLQAKPYCGQCENDLRR